MSRQILIWTDEEISALSATAHKTLRLKRPDLAERIDALTATKEASKRKAARKSNDYSIFLGHAPEGMRDVEQLMAQDLARFIELSLDLEHKYPGRTIPMFHKRGVIGAAVELVSRGGEVSSGFQLLLAAREIERTAEYRIGVTFANRFPSDLVAKARATLDEHGVAYPRE